MSTAVSMDFQMAHAHGHGKAHEQEQEPHIVGDHTSGGKFDQKLTCGKNFNYVMLWFC